MYNYFLMISIFIPRIIVFVVVSMLFVPIIVVIFPTISLIFLLFILLRGVTFTPSSKQNIFRWHKITDLGANSSFFVQALSMRYDLNPTC